MKIAVHVTHEAAMKIGGIGAVLNGVITTDAYKGFFDATVIYGPLFDFGGGVSSCLGVNGEVHLSTKDFHVAPGYGDMRDRVGDIVSKYDIELVYGRRKLYSEFDRTKENVADVFLVGTNRMNPGEVNKFKYVLWEYFGIQSDLYEGDWDYEQYVRIAIPYLKLLERFYGADAQYYHFSHEYMGMPSALSVVAAGRKDVTVFVAHEVSTARTLVEELPGHDISFYNIMKRAGKGKSLEQLFGSFKHSPRNELIKCAVKLDRVFAVSDIVRDEYLWLTAKKDPSSAKSQAAAVGSNVRTVFNGVSARRILFDEKIESRRRIRAYIARLIGYEPDIILTHVARMVVSKGLWRDVALLYLLDEIFRARNIKGAYILLASLIGAGRPGSDALRMEAEYGWPVSHRKGWPDLVGMEADMYVWLDLFNRQSKAIKGVFINQFGFDRASCGTAVPEGTTLDDLRAASDAELGFSIYEPFGIAQIETVPFGGIAVMSSTCGSARFIEDAFAEAVGGRTEDISSPNAQLRPYHIVDFTAAGATADLDSLKRFTQEQRDRSEREILAKHATRIFDALPKNDSDRERYLLLAQQHAEKMSWEHVVKSRLLPNLST